MKRNGQGSDQNLPPNASGVTNAARGARDKTKKCPRQPQLPMLRGSREAIAQRWSGKRSSQLSKHAQSSHQSRGGANSQPDGNTVYHAARSVGAKSQKQVDHSQSSAPQSKNSPESSNAQKHQQKQAQQSAPSLAEQNKPSQPPPKASHHEQNSRRSTPSAQQDNPSRPSNASDGKGKGGREKKSDKKEEGEKKDKGDH